MTFLPDDMIADLGRRSAEDLARWPMRCGRLEGALELLIIQAESAAELLALGDEQDAASLRRAIAGARAILNEERTS